MELEKLERAGRALYGPFWQCEIARSLGVNQRTVRRYLEKPDAPIPEHYRAPLVELCAARIGALQELLLELCDDQP